MANAVQPSQTPQPLPKKPSPKFDRSHLTVQVYKAPDDSKSPPKKLTATPHVHSDKTEPTQAIAKKALMTP